MRRTLWIILTVLLVAIGAPSAHADQTVDVTVPSFTFNGLPGCPPPPPLPGGTCMETFSTSFEWDNTAGAVIIPSIVTTAAGPLGSFSFLGQVPCALCVELEFVDSATDSIEILIPATAGGVISPGVFPTPPGPNNLALQCASLSEPCTLDFFPGVVLGSDPITVTAATGAVPEPGTVSLVLLGIGSVSVLRKRLAHGIPRAT